MVEIKLDLGRVVPIFADEVMVMHNIKAAKEDGKGIKKEGQVRLIFIDVPGHRAVVETVISPMTAKSLYNILGDNLEKLEKELKSKKLPEKPVVSKPATTTKHYIG